MKSLLIGLFLVPVVMPTRGEAQVVRTWVAPSGSDANACSRTQPCRNFSAAIAAVSSGGEVVVLDSGGFGAVTIDKSVSIISPAGVHAAIAPTSGNAITVSATSTDIVVLRNLYLNGQGGAFGINHSEGGQLHVEGCTIANFGNSGILFQSAGPYNRLFVSRATVRNNADGISLIVPATGLVGGVIEDSSLIANTLRGLNAGVFTQVVVRNTSAAGNDIGFGVNAVFPSYALLVLDNCAAMSNRVGLQAEGNGASLHVANTLAARNSEGMALLAGGTAATFGNNKFVQNGGFNSFTSTLPFN